MTTMKTLRATSLIEVMIAASILLIVLTSTSMAIAFGVRHVGHTRRVAEAERIAAAQMESLLVDGRRTAAVVDPNGRFAVPRPRNNGGSQRFSADGRADDDGDYTATWTIQSDRPVVGGLRLHVEVSWQENGPRSLGLTTYFEVPDPCDLPDDDERRGGIVSRNGGVDDPCRDDGGGFGGFGGDR